jgi:type IV pilus assembly protein PilM
VESPAKLSRLQAEAVADMLEHGNFTGRDTIIALPWHELQARNVRIPPMPDEEIGDVVRFESAERLGLELDDAEIRYIVAGDVRQGTETRQEVMVFGAARSKIEAHIHSLTKIGLTPIAIDAGPCAVFRGFERFLRRTEDHQKVNAFVDLGYTGTRVVISRGAELIFFKAIPIGGQRFDQLVSEQLDLTVAEAAQIRIRLHRQHVIATTGVTELVDGHEPVGENIRHAVLDALRPALEQLGKEIGLCLRYCSVTFRGLRSEVVTAVGGEAGNGDILKLLADQINVPVRVGRPMRNIATEDGPGGADRRSGQPEWGTAAGLALKLPPAEAEVA